MDKLILKRRLALKRATNPNTYYRLRVDMEGYNMVTEVAEETGLSIKDTVSIMIKYAFAHIEYESEDE